MKDNDGTIINRSNENWKCHIHVLNVNGLCIDSFSKKEHKIGERY
jgi:hypothetical protein